MNACVCGGPVVARMQLRGFQGVLGDGLEGSYIGRSNLGRMVSSVGDWRGA